MNKEQVREFIAQQICPFCKKGPFKVLPVHTCKIHGVDKWRLRELAGYSGNDRISAPEFCDDAADRMRALYASGYVAPGTGRHDPRPKVNKTTAGIEANRRAIVSYMGNMSREERSEQAKRAAGHVPHEVRRRAAVALGLRIKSDPVFRAGYVERGKRAENVERLRRNATAARDKAIAATVCGTVKAYKRGCRCDLCRAAKAASRSSGHNPLTVT